MSRILIVDDEQNIVNVLREYAEYEGFDVDCSFDGVQALNRFEKQNYDCVLIDVMMPNLNGFDTVKAMKEIKNTPIIIMSARTQEEDKLQGFALGADDYVSKPFSPKEVMARLKAILKRTCGYNDLKNVANVSLDFENKRILLNGVDVGATMKEFDLLDVLIRNKGFVVSREKLLNEIWGFDYDKDERTVDTHIKMLRAHLGSSAKYVKTVRGLGYAFKIEP